MGVIENINYSITNKKVVEALPMELREQLRMVDVAGRVRQDPHVEDRAELRQVGPGLAGGDRLLATARVEARHPGTAARRSRCGGQVDRGPRCAVAPGRPASRQVDAMATAAAVPAIEQGSGRLRLGPIGAALPRRWPGWSSSTWCRLGLLLIHAFWSVDYLTIDRTFTLDNIAHGRSAIRSIRRVLLRTC